MATPQARLGITPASYLAFERAAEERHEYDNGVISAMAGESTDHSRICINIAREVSTRLKGKPCEAFSPNMKIGIGAATAKFYYPDLSVVCGAPRYHDRHKDVLLNPVVIIEVLSPSTEKKDRREKFQDYGRIESLQEYVLIAQDRPFVEHYVRQADGWRYTAYADLHEAIRFAALDCAVELAEIYDRVVFPEAEAELAETDAEAEETSD